MWTRRSVLTAGAALGAGLLLPLPAAMAATDQLRVGLRREPPHLDPTADGNPETIEVSYQNLFEGLTRIDERGAVGPGLAQAWTVSADGLTHLFTLRGEVRYHDGTSFDAEHVVFSLNRLRGAANTHPNRKLFDVIADVGAVDAGTAKVVLKRADPKFLFNLGRPEAAMVAPESADNNKAVPIGTGPFALVQWDSGQRALLERNEDYWGPHPRINEAIFVFIADPVAALAALAANEIDGFADFAPAEIPPGLKTDPAFKVLGGTALGAPRVGVWNERLEGQWTDAPLGGCVLADIHWPGAAAPAARPAPSPDASGTD